VVRDLLQLPEDVRDLLVTVDSFEKLEVVCRMGSKPTSAWTMLEISEGVGMSPDVLEEPVRALVVAGLLVRTDDRRLRLATMNARTAQAVDALTKLYANEKLLVVRAVTQLAMERIRSTAARTFADAFVIRRKKPEEPS
jgi:hypothetical protein